MLYLGALILYVYANSDDAPSPLPGALPGSGTPLSSGDPAAPTPSGGSGRSVSRSADVTQGASTLPRLTYTLPVPGGLVFAPSAGFRVTLSVRSAVPVPRLGYLVPSSYTDPYGDIRDVGTSWSLTTVAHGKPAYAAIFIQAAGAGTPITCTITVNGVVTSTETTKGAYGRQVCLG